MATISVIGAGRMGAALVTGLSEALDDVFVRAVAARHVENDVAAVITSLR